MIQKLIIRNFRSNKRLDVVLDRHITCITGESYRGKSNALRALRWVALNRPAGNRFIRWGSKGCVVRIDVERHQVFRRKSRTQNVYQVDGRILEAFGSNVPASVQKILNLSQLNFQVQQEMPPGDGPLFWFALTPGQISKRLNQIVNLDVIDRTLSRLQSEVQKSKSTVEICQERRKQAHEQVRHLAYVQQMAADWEKVQQTRKACEELDEKENALAGVLNEVIVQTTILQATRHHLREADEELRVLEDLQRNVIKLERQQQVLESLIEYVENLQAERTEALKQKEVAQQAYDKALGNRCPFTGETCPLKRRK